MFQVVRFTLAPILPPSLIRLCLLFVAIPSEGFWRFQAEKAGKSKGCRQVAAISFGFLLQNFFYLSELEERFMSETKTFQATVREQVGKGPSKAARREGLVPCVLYSAGCDPINVNVDAKSAKAIVHHPAILPLEIDGTTHRCLVKEVQRHFLTQAVQHVDLQIIQEGRKISTIIPIAHRGEAEGLHHGGLLEQMSHSMKVECLPKHLPEKILIDVSHLNVGNRILVRDVDMPENVCALSEPTAVLFSIHLPRAVVAAVETIAEPEAVAE